MKQKSTQPESNLTWANIFVNSNYNKFLLDWVNGIFKNKNIILICNKKSNVKNLPFNPKFAYFVGTNAWKNDYSLIETLKKDISKNNIKNHIFLFAVGPFSNILIHQLYIYNKNNIYLNIGSTLDVILELGITRGYLSGNKNLLKICQW